MSRSKSTRKKLFRQITAAILVVMLLAAGLIFLRNWDRRQGVVPPDNEGSDEYSEPDRFQIRYNNAWYELRDNLETVLLIGLDKFEDGTENNSYNNDRQSDFLLLGVFDHTNKTLSAIHINRDTMADVPVLSVNGSVVDQEYQQLAFAYTYGSGGHDSCRNTRNAVSALLYDLPIDHYVAVTMDAVAVLNDTVGGVTVTIPEDMTAVDPAMVLGEEVTLTGEQALAFVRARQQLEDSSNLNRMERQRTYLQALSKQLVDAYNRDPDFWTDASLQLYDKVITDYSLPTLQSTANTVSVYQPGQIYSLPGEAKVGEKYMEFYVDEPELQKLLVSLMFDEQPSP